MPLPSSGEVSLGSIRVELVNTATSDFGLRPAGRPVSHGLPGGADPPRVTPVNQNSPSIPNDMAEYAISEWYQYDHAAFGECSESTFLTPQIGRFFTYYKIRVTGNPGQVSQVVVVPNGLPSNIVYANFYTNYPFNTDGTLNPSLTPEIRLSGSTTDPLVYLYTLTAPGPIFFHIVCFETSTDAYRVVYIRLCCESVVNLSGQVTIYASAGDSPNYATGSPVNLGTGLAIDIYVLTTSGASTGSMSITGGASTGVLTLSGLTPNSVVLDVLVANLFPTAYGFQIYEKGLNRIGGC